MAETQDLPASKTAEKFVVRLPQGMRQRIASAAKHYRRSMNSEIVARLEQSLASGDLPEDEHGMAAEAEPPSHQATAIDISSNQVNAQLSGTEASLINAYRRMPDSKRRALMELIG